MNCVLEESRLPELHYLGVLLKEVSRFIFSGSPPLVPGCANAWCLIGGHLVPEDPNVIVNALALPWDSSLCDNPWCDPTLYLLRYPRLSRPGGSYHQNTKQGLTIWWKYKNLTFIVSIKVKLFQPLLNHLNFCLEWLFCYILEIIFPKLD